MMRHEPENLDEQLTGDPNRPVTIAEARTEFEANVIVATLRDAGIEAHAFDQFRQALPFQSHFSGIPVQVRATDEVAAKEALAQRISDSVDIDWNEVDVGERDDSLPLHVPGRMPPAAKAAFVVALIIVVATLAAGLLAIIL